MTSADGFSDPEIFGRTDYEPEAPSKREFKAWHKPRKQFVREEQWIKLAQRILEGRDGAAPLRYLGLPGTDLLDIRCLYRDVCEPTSRTLRFLGFNSESGRGSSTEQSSAMVELQTSLHEIKHLEHVDLASMVLSDDFRSLAKADSMATKGVRELAPFDVVNLDLCDGLGSDGPEADPSIYAALDSLVSLQVRNPNPWLLLITSRMGREHFHVETRTKLVAHFQRNVDDCDGFAEECLQLFQASALPDPSTCKEDTFLRLMLLSLCKWLASLAYARSANRVELASSQSYQIYAGAAGADLVSFALIFTPVIDSSPDPFVPTATAADECETAIRFARRAKQLKDVDAILESDQPLRERLVEKTAKLLAEARYDPDDYYAWLGSVS